MAAVSMTGCVLVVRSSCSFGPAWISAATSSPSASDASRRVCRTAGWSPQASSMPTDCEPCPGKTNANEAIACVSPMVRKEKPRAAASEIEQHRAPGEAAADALEQDGVAAADLAGAHRDVERQRNRGGRGVAVLVDRDDELVQRQLQLLRGALHDANVRLVRDQP